LKPTCAGGRLIPIVTGLLLRITRARLLELSSILCLCLLTVACSVTEPYPQDWSDLVASQERECGDISGAYYNSCIPASGMFDCLKSGGLAALLFGKYPAAFHPKLATVNRVTIEQSFPSRLVVKAWKGSDLLRLEEIELERQDCTKEGVLIRGGSTVTNIENAAGYGSSRALFRKDEQGDLVARVRIHFTGIVLLVPASFTGTDWYRFEAHSNKDVEVKGSEPLDSESETPER